jgi:hypothetical protein
MSQISLKTSTIIQFSALAERTSLTNPAQHDPIKQKIEATQSANEAVN